MQRAINPRPSLPAARMLASWSVLACLALSGCKLVDQRTFDATANTKPVARVPRVAPGPAPAPPLAAIRFGASPDSWQPDLAGIVRMALERKPLALFSVQTVVPAKGTPQQQAAALAEAGGTSGRLVAETIVSAGASSAQIQMTALSDGSVSEPEVRVYVK